MLPFPGRLQAGLPPYSPVFKSWIHCWKYLSMQVSFVAASLRGKIRGCQGIQCCEQDKENVNVDLV